MAEETLRYKVELDAADLAPQLEALRQQIDVALGSSAAQASPAGGMTGFLQAANMAGGGFTPPVGSFSMPPAAAHATSAIQQTAQILDQSVERASLGFSKFMDDTRRIGLMSPVAFPDFSPPLGRARAEIPQTFGGQVAGALGFGHDPRGTLSAGAFQDLSSQTMADTAADFVAGSPAMIAGAAIGTAIGGPVGTVVGAGVGIVGDVALNAFAGRARERSQLGRGLQEMATQTFGNISRAEGRAFAGELQDRATSFESRLEDFGMEDIQEVIQSFGAAGGFEGTQNITELRSRVKDVLDNVRQVAHMGNMVQEEAAVLMGSLQGTGVVGLGDMGAFMGTQQALGAQVGMTGQEFINMGLAGAEMTRGTRIGSAAGFNLMQQSRVAAEQGLADPGTAAVIQDMGGVQNASAAIAENTMRHMQGGLGLLQTMGVMGGAPGISQGVEQDFVNASNVLAQDPSNMLRAMFYQGPMINQMLREGGQIGMQANIVNKYVGLAQSTGMGVMEGGQIDPSVLAPLLARGENMSINEAELMLRNVSAGPEGQRTATLSAFNATIQGIHDEAAVGIGRRISANVGDFFQKTGEATGITQLAGSAWTAVSDATTDLFESGGDLLRGQSRIRGSIITDASVIARAKEMDFDKLIAEKGIELGAFDESLREDAKTSMTEYENFARVIGGPGHGSVATAGLALLKDNDDLMTHVGGLLNNAASPEEKRKIMGQLVRVGNNSSSAEEVSQKLAIANQIAGAATVPKDELEIERRMVAAKAGDWRKLVSKTSNAAAFDIVAEKSYGVEFAKLNEAQTRAVSGILADEGIKVGVAALGEGTTKDTRAGTAYIADLEKKIAHTQAGVVGELQGMLEEAFGDEDFAGIDEDAGAIVSDYFTRQQEAAAKGVSPEEFLKGEMSRTTKDRTEGLGGFSLGDLFSGNAAQRERFEGILLSQSRDKDSNLHKLNELSLEKSAAIVSVDRQNKEKEIRSQWETAGMFNNTTPEQRAHMEKAVSMKAWEMSEEGQDFLTNTKGLLTASTREGIQSAIAIMSEGMGSEESIQRAAAVAGKIGITEMWDKGLLGEDTANKMLNSYRDPIAIQDAMKTHLQKIASAITEDGKMRLAP